MQAPRRLQLRRGNTAAVSTYLGAPGELIINTDTNTLYVHNGVTVGGIASTVNTSAITSNISSLQSSVAVLQGNILTLESGITTLTSNAAVQAGVLAILLANAGAQSGDITTLLSNASVQSGDLATLTSNAATQAGLLATLTSNAASQSGTLADLIANAAVQAGAIVTANTAMKGYVDAAVTGIVIPEVYGNANVAAYLTNPSTTLSSLNVTTAGIAQINGTNPGSELVIQTGGSRNFNFRSSGNLEVPGSIIPTANVAYSLGNITHQWRDLFVGNNTIYIGGVPLGIDAGGNLLVNGNTVQVGAGYSNSNVASYLPTYSGNIAGNIVKNGYTWTFSNTGTTTFPTGVRLSNARGPNTVNFTTDIDKSFQIETQTSTTGRLWSFGTDGNLTLPQNANINYSNGVSILAGITGSYGNTQVATYLPTYTGNIAGNIVKNGYTWTFGSTGTLTVPASGIITAPNAQEFRLQARAADSVLRNEIELDPNNGTYMSVWSEELETSFSTGAGSWATASWVNASGFGAAYFTGAEDLQDFWTTGPGSFVESVEVSINGGARGRAGYEGNNGEQYGVELSVDRIPVSSPTTITSLVFYYRTKNRIDIDYANGQMLLKAQSMNINLETTNYLNLRGLGAYPVRIITNNNTHMWEFDSAGSLTLPREGKIYGIGDGGPGGNRYGYISWDGESSGDGSGFNTMRLVPDLQGLEDLDTYIILDPAYVDGPGSIHIRAGGTRDNSLANLYLGGANSHVKISAGENPPVTVLANNNAWTFGTDGTTTFPGNLVIAGNTNVFGTNGALIQPANDLPLLALSSGANGAVSSIWVEDIGNIGTSNIAAVYANPTVGSKIVRIAVGQNGGPYGPNLWDFGNTGTTRFPNSTILAPAGQNITMQSDQYSQLMWENANVTVAPDMAINSNFYVAQNSATLDIVYRDGSSTQQQKSWLWTVDGSLTLPAGGVIAEGGGISGAIRLTPAGGANANQALVIYPTAGAPEGDHVHLTAGGGTTELYLGNDFHYVKLVDGGNIELRAATANLSAQASWEFDTTGNIDARQALGIKVPNGVPSDVAVINSTTGSWELNPMSNLATTGGSGTGLTVNVTETGGYASTIAIATAGTGYTNGDLITVTSGTSNATFTIVIGGRNSWTFGTSGNLTLPSDGYLRITSGITTTGASPAPIISGFTITNSQGISGNGNITTTQYVNAGYFTGNGALLTGIVATSSYSNVQVKALLATAVGFDDGYQRKIEGYYGNLILNGSQTQLYSYGATAKSYFGHDGFLGNASINYIRADNGDVRIATNNGAYAWIFDRYGNLTLSGNTFSVNYANGTPVTFSSSSYSNVEVAAYLPTYSGNVSALNFVGAIQAQVGSSFAYATDGYGSLFVSGGVALPADTNSNAIVAGYTIVGNSGAVTLTVTSATFIPGTPNIVQVATTPTASLLAFPVTVYTANYSPAKSSTITVGNATVSGNVSAQYFLGNGALLTGIVASGSSYSNVEVAAYLPTYSGNIGNIALAANLGATSGSLATLTANAASQAGSLATITSVLTSSNVGIGFNAGATSQGESAVAVGSGAGTLNQGIYSVAIGLSAGTENQGARSVAVGLNAGRTNQGEYAVAIGRSAGFTNQGNNSIIINATTGVLNQTTANTFTVAPVRNDVANISQIMFYNTTSKEVTYGNIINIAGNVSTTGYFIGNGALLTGIVASAGTTYSNTNVAAYLTTANITTTGNITAGNLTTGGALYVANITTTGSSGNISGANYITANVILTNGGWGNISQVANIQANAILVSGNVTSTYFIGNGALLTGIVSGGASTYSNTNVAAYLTTVGTSSAFTFGGNAYNDPRLVLTHGSGGIDLIANATNSGIRITASNAIILSTVLGNVYVTSGNITTPGIKTDGYYYANGTPVSFGGGNYSNANVATYLTNYDGDINFTSSVAIISNVDVITVLDHIRSPSYQYSNGVSILSGLGYGNTEVASYLPTYSGNIGGNVSIGGTLRIRSANSQPFTTNDALYVDGGVTAGGNISSGGRLVACSFAISTSINSGAIQTNGGIGAWGNIYAGQNIVATGNITAQNLIGNISITGNVTGTSANVTLQAGAYTSVFDNQGNVRLPTAYVTGNVTANYFVGNGSLLSGVATKTTGSWTVTTGTNTYSIQLAENGTYQIWVIGNIPNGIISYNATATITNGNVPVVGAQYAWVYNGGGTPIDFTSIPNQFVGTGNTIVRSSVAPSATTNRFDFGINNTSGGNVTVSYGYVKIS